MRQLKSFINKESKALVASAIATEAQLADLGAAIRKADEVNCLAQIEREGRSSAEQLARWRAEEAAAAAASSSSAASSGTKPAAPPQEIIAAIEAIHGAEARRAEHARLAAASEGELRRIDMNQSRIRENLKVRVFDDPGASCKR